MSVLNKIRPINYIHFSNVSKSLLCFIQKRNCYSIFGIKDLVQHEKPESFSIVPVQSSHHETAVRMVKRYFLTEHVFVRARHMDLNNDRAIDEYIIGLLKQGNSLFAKTANDTIAGFCINFAASPVDPQNLRNYAFYRQIKMLAVIPEYRRQGLATMLAQKSKSQAKDQGYKVIRMDCINPYDYKIAERCMLSCIVKFPLHKLRVINAPFIKKSSEHNTSVRVFVEAPVKQDSPDMKQIDLESMFE